MSTFEEAYELTGHGIFNHLALLTNGFILLYVTVECLGLGYVLTKADCDLGVSVRERGAISAATFIGVVTPAIVWGYLADAYGRRRVMLPATLLAVLFSILSSFSQNFFTMFILRICTGAMVSASCATAYVYLGELTSPSHRAVSIAWGSAFIAGSYFMMPLSAWIFLPLKFSVPVTDNLSIVPWRVLMWVYTIWGSAACAGMFILPESPSFVLATQGGPAAQVVLARIYSWNLKKAPDEFPVKELHAAHSCRPSFKKSINQMKYLVRPPLLRCIIISHICNFMVFMQSNAFYVWMPHIVDELLVHGPKRPGTSMSTLLNDIHANIELVMDECDPQDVDIRVYPIATSLGILTVFVYLTIGFGMRRWGKQRVYCVIMTSCAVLILVSAVVPHAALAITLFIPGLCGIAANTVLAAAIVEVIPTSLRALAMCTLFMVGRLGAAVGANMLAWGLQRNCLAIVMIITIMTAVSGILLYTWPDTNKTRAEMEAKDFNY